MQDIGSGERMPDKRENRTQEENGPTHQELLAKSIQSSIDDVRSGVPHEGVMAGMMARIAAWQHDSVGRSVR